MPSEVMPLYLGHAMSDLNKMAEITQKVLNAKVFIKSADKVYSAAQDAMKKGDEEKAYVMYMKYFNIITLVKKSADFKKNADFYNKLISTTNALKAIEAAEKLASNLKDRYDLVEAEKVSAKLGALEIEREKANRRKEEEKTKLEENEEKETAEEKEVDDVPPGAITVPQTYCYMNNKEVNLILMDVRPTKEYDNSHINDKRCISVPADIIPPGRTVTYIEPELPAASKELWLKRGMMDYIILLDWCSNVDQLKPGTTLRTLKDAIFKYDSTTIVRTEPLVLEGGYENWLLHYPTVTTNANVPLKPPPDINLSNNLLDFDYPDFDETFLTPKPEPAKLNNADVTHPLNNQDVSQKPTPEGTGKVPMVNRALKPQKPGQPFETLENNSSTFIHNKIDKSLFVDNLGTKNTNVQAPSNVELAKNLPNSQTMDNVDLDKFISQTRVVPAVDRSLKPKGETVEKPVRPTLSQEADTLAQELKELQRLKLEREAELEKYKADQERIILEQKSRLAKLKEEEMKMEELETMRHKEEKTVAELMREKRKVQEEITAAKAKFSDEQRIKEEEERRKREEIARMEEKENQKLRLQEEVTRMRNERVAKETEDVAKVTEEVKVGPTTDAKPSVVESPTEPAAGTPEPETKPAPEPSLKKTKPEMPEVSTSPTESKPVPEIGKEKPAPEQKIESKPKPESQSTPEKVPASETMPAGWEKRYHQQNKKYYYIDHNTGTTSWEPPKPKCSESEVYKTKLKDEPSAKTPSSTGGGMRRSTSTPNIASMADEGDVTVKPEPPKPSVNRVAKPRELSKPSRTNTFLTLDADKIMSLNPDYGKSEPGLTGLRNQGNTCYMNSIIQCLSNTVPLVSYFLSNNYRLDINRENFLGCNGEVADELALVVMALWSTHYRHVTPRDFKHTVSRHNPLFAGYNQQDSQEFLIFLLDGLHEDLNMVKSRPKVREQNNDGVPDHVAAEVAWKTHKLLNESIIVELFQGQLKSTLMCLRCNKTSVTFETVMHLSLPLPTSSSRCSIQDCFRLYLQEEKLTGSCKWFCPQCKARREAIKKTDIWKLPAILLIHLKRFQTDGSWHQKLNTYVDFPLQGFDLKSYVRGHRVRPDYRLYAISNHYGTMEGGHYTAYCNNYLRRSWLKFDDSDVTPISDRNIKTSAAYILFYTSIPDPDRRS